MADNKVKFLRGTSDKYAVAEKDNDTIYFTTDDGKLYIGDKEISGDGSLTIDDKLSDTSINPVQNKVINSALAGKAASSHNQASNTITAMTGYSKASSASAIAAGDSLNTAIGKLEKALDSKQPSGLYAAESHKHDDRYYTESEVDTKLSGKLNTSLKGAANGLAELDSSGKVPSAQLPSYVDDVLEYTNKSSFPTTGESGKIYIAQDTNKTYRWSGSAYTEISSSLALGETSATAYRGDRGKVAYDHSQTAHAPSNAQANVIETVKVNGTALTPSSKAVNITVPTVGNGTITITQNGTTKGTFTTNQSGNATIALDDNNTVYTHPTSDGNKHVPANGTSNDGKYLKATATAGSYEWGSLTKSDVTTALGYTPPTTNTTYSAGTGLSLSGTKFNHSNSVTAGTAQGDASKTLSFGGTFTIPTVTYDAQGHITGKGTTTMTMPANPNTDTKVTNTLATTTKAYVTGTTSATTNTGTQVFDTGVYLDTTAGMLTATTFKGTLSGNASTATKLGTSTVGDTAKPIYLNAGAPTALSSTVGSTDIPVYLNAGTITSTGKSFSSYLPLAGGTMTGALVAQSNTAYTTAQVRNATMSTSAPSGGSNGQIHYQYS